MVVSFQFAGKPVQNQIRLRQGGGARGGGSPPRMGSNAPEVLLCKASGKRSADFCAAVRRKSNGIFAGCQKSPWTFLTAWRACRAKGRALCFCASKLRQNSPFCAGTSCNPARIRV